MEQKSVIQSIIQSHGITLLSYEQIFGEDQDLQLADEVADAKEAELRAMHGLLPLGPSMRPMVSPAIQSLMMNRFSNPNMLGFRYPNVNTTEIARQQIDDLFDSLKSIDDFPETESSDRLKSTLYKHQKMALTFLIQRERDFDVFDKKSVISSFWKAVKHVNQTVYKNLLTGAIVTSPPREAKGGILADEMGLGKTITVISLILTNALPPHVRFKEPYGSKGTLIICPPSVVSVWQDQISTHVKSSYPLKVYLYHGANRDIEADALRRYDVVLTTYSTLAMAFKKASSSPSVLHQIYWFRLVLDEAHGIKEASTLQAKAVHALEADCRWCITGTPLVSRQVAFFNSFIVIAKQVG